MKKIVCLFSVAGALLCLLLLVPPTFTSKATHDDEIDWPTPVDQFDQHLINLVRSRRQAADDDVEEETTTTAPDASSSTTSSAPETSSEGVDETSDSSSSTSAAASESTTASDVPSSATVASGKTNSTKNFTIDWNEVERRWQETISEEEVGKKWKEMETGMKNGVRSLLRTLFPQVVALSSDAKVSGNCSAGILKWIISLRHLKGWAVKMLDAIGKPPAGMMQGSVTIFGNHKQCLDIRAPDDEDDFEEDESDAPPKFKEFFRGKYCVLELKPWLPPKPRYYGFNSKIKALERDPNDDSVFQTVSEVAIFMHFISLRFDLCVPSLCTREDIQRVANFIASKLDIRAKVSRCEVTSDSFVEVNSIQVLAGLGLIGSIGLVSMATAITLLAPVLSRRNRSAPTLIKLLSLTRSWKEMNGVASYHKSHKLPSLYGLRYIILIWMFMVETLDVIGFGFLRDMLPLKEIALSRSVQFITNSSLRYSSFIFISAFLMGYYNDGKGSWKAIKFLARKIFRMAPAVAVGTAVMLILPMMDTNVLKGPVWFDIMHNRTEACKVNWWRNVFFIQNFFPPQETCMPWTWILCVELQLACFFIFVLGIMSAMKDKSKDLSWIVLVMVTLIGFAANFFEVYLNDMPPTWFWTLPDPERKNDYYHRHLFRPWTHLSVYAIGVGLGFFCANRDKDSPEGPYGKVVTRVIGWGFVSVVSALLIFMNHDWVLGSLPDAMTSGLYDGFHRIMWSIAHCVMIYFIVCDLDSEHSISRAILGNKYLITFGRLSLSAFVLHPIVQLLFFATQYTQLFSGPMVALYFFFGNIGLTYVLAFFVVLFFELPTSAIFKTRESTIVKKDFLPKMTMKPNSYTVNSGPQAAMRNGDIEMSKSRDSKEIVMHRL